ncbi:uncharacterized protein DEA37_0012805 [Paragonimus westermani]|uniref:Cadherin domain-containing protein n=1 Tax=Paragonimus westermani TaxID=34504 RepID=A0A5J4N7N2_9TREM|nr:uncharacterized protein DEA37_0012805 [Paragonimus westermani]
MELTILQFTATEHSTFTRKSEIFNRHSSKEGVQSSNQDPVMNKLPGLNKVREPSEHWPQIATAIKARCEELYATDDDAGDNGTINYFIKSGNSENYFLLDQYSGTIQIGADLSGYAVGEYMLHLEARDCGHPSRSAFGSLVVEIDRSPPKSALMPAQLDPSRFGYLGLGATGYTFNLYILIAIVVASGTISALLLVSICLFMRRSRRTRRACTNFSSSSNGVIPNSSKPVSNTKAEKYLPTYPVTNAYHSGTAVDVHPSPYVATKLSITNLTPTNWWTLNFFKILGSLSQTTINPYMQNM